jgi:GNAT superfamily N-acetyltransferase
MKTVHLRDPAPGDLGWIVERHGALYAEEYGWDVRFEGLVAKVIADFIASPPAGQRAWIGELDGARAGSVLCTRKDERTAQLRLLLVEPWARGSGLGGRLVDACLGFARAEGYARMVLWTNSCLDAARRIYERAGFALDDEAPHALFGEGLVGQHWSLSLG